jgi:WD40 repeat protein
MATSYQASNLGLQEIDSARLVLGWNKTDDRWLEAAEVSRATLNRFLKREKVKHDTFVNICKAVGIENWRRIRQSEMPTAAKSGVMPIALPSRSLENFAEQMRRWFGALRYEIEQELEQTEGYFQWMIRIPVRSRFDLILLRGMTREIEFLDLHQMTGAINAHQPDETWLVTDFRVNPAVAEKAKMQGYPLLCMTFDELIDQDVDFSPYIQWLVEEVEGQEIDERYIQLGCKRSEIDPQTQDYLGTHPYPAEIDDGLEGYIDGWLEATEKYHVSVLGEFGMGKTWFSLHYAWRELQKYLKAKETQRKRPRLPLLMPLRDYSKAVDVENVLAHFFFGKHKIRLHNEVFDRLNEMGKLLLIFDGFDEMSNKTSKQEMADNFWRLTQVAVPGAKVILTSRQEHFPDDGNARLLFGGKIPSSQSKLVAPQFELVELEPFTEVQMRRMLGQHTDEPTVDLIMAQPHLRDLAQRPVMGQLLVAALGDLQRDLAAGKSIDLARVYFYAVRQKMETDIRSDRTFTSLADKTFFLGELAGAMYGQEKLSLHFSEFPEQLRSMFGLEDRELDYWCYDMAGETLLIRDREGNYKFAHNSLREFFVAYKFAAELGLLHADFWGLVAGCGMVGSTWSEVRRGLRSNVSVQEFRGFLAEPPERLVETFGRFPLRQSKVVTDLLLVMLDVQVGYRQTNPLLELMQWTRGRNFNTVGYVGGNAGNLLLAKYPYGLEYQDLSRTVLPALNLWGAGLRQVDLTDADLAESCVSKSFSRCNVIVISPDNNYFVTGHENGSICMWDIFSGQEIAGFTGHDCDITSLVISDDGYWMFSASYDGLIKKWNTETTICENTFSDEQGWLSLAVGNDGDWLFSASDNGLKKWNTKSGEYLFSFLEDAKGVRSMVLSNDGQYLFLNNDAGAVQKYNAKTGEYLFSYLEDGDLIKFLTLSNDDCWLFAGDEVCRVSKWNIDTGECINTFSIDEGWVTSFTLSGDESWLFSGIYNGAVNQWNAETGILIGSLTSEQELASEKIFSDDDFDGWYEYSTAFLTSSNDGRWLLASGGDYNNTIKCWDIKDKRHQYTLLDSKVFITSCISNTNNGYLLTTDSSNMIRRWNTETNECIEVSAFVEDSVTCFIINDDNDWLFSQADNMAIKKWNMKTKECVYTRTNQEEDEPFIVSGDGRWLFLAREDGEIEKWDTKAGLGEDPYYFIGHTESIVFLKLIENANILFSVSVSGTLKKWNITNGKCINTLTNKFQYSTSLAALSENGEYFFSGCYNGLLNKWDAETGELIYSFVSLSKMISSLVLSKDGYWVFAGYDDGKITKWNMSTGECSYTLVGHKHSVIFLTLSKDECWLFSWCHGEAVKKWNAQTGEFLATLGIDLYSGAQINRARGLTIAQKQSLIALGAVVDREEENSIPPDMARSRGE